MSSKINIFIPEPCHENWQEMTAIDKGRFCNSCQKKVIDFTNANDQEILNAFKLNDNLCGRFLDSQLNRDLIKPKEKSSLWLAASSAFISLIGLGTHEVQAQEQVKTEQTDNSSLNKFNSYKAEEIFIRGAVFNENGDKLPEVLIQVKNKKNIIYTDNNGDFRIKIAIGDTLIFTKNNFIRYEISFTSEKNGFRVLLESGYQKKINAWVGGACLIKKRTFFGRVFYSVGNWFK